MGDTSEGKKREAREWREETEARKEERTKRKESEGNKACIEVKYSQGSYSG